MTAPENRLAVGRDNGGRFAKGVTGNPGGRPKGLASYIREQTHDGEDLADFILKVFLGEEIDGYKPNTAMRMDAATWLSDRGFGRPVQGVVHTGMMTRPWEVLKDVSLEDIKTLALAYRALQEQKANAIEGEARILELPADADE